MGKLLLTLACGDYDRTRALANGRVQPEGIALNYIALEPKELFWRMLRYREFDASELSLSNYIMTRSQGKKWFIALPVFPSRVFRHSAIYVSLKSGIKKPEDLAGKRVGLREYHMTAAVWVRGILQQYYGVSPQKIQWFKPSGQERLDYRLPRGLRIEDIPLEKSLSGMLETGELDALIDPGVPEAFARGKAKRLFPDYRTAEADYFRRTGIFPIMHTAVIKEEIYQRYPWVAYSLYKAFCQAKEICYQSLFAGHNPITSAWLGVALGEERKILGEDLWPYGLEANKKTIETLMQYQVEQGLISKKIPMEQLFAPATLGAPVG